MTGGEKRVKHQREKMSKHGIQITCGSCGAKGHNKSGCLKNGDRTKKAKSYLGKRRRNQRAAEQAQTDASRSTPPASSQVPKSTTAANTQDGTSSSQTAPSRFRPPRVTRSTNPEGSTSAGRGTGRASGRGTGRGTGRGSGRGNGTGLIGGAWGQYFYAGGNY